MVAAKSAGYRRQKSASNGHLQLALEWHLQLQHRTLIQVAEAVCIVNGVKKTPRSDGRGAESRNNWGAGVPAERSISQRV